MESERTPLTEPTGSRRSTRERRLPARFKDYVMEKTVQHRLPMILFKAH